MSKLGPLGSPNSRRYTFEEKAWLSACSALWGSSLDAPVKVR